ncbi:MAG: hypothetical protein MUE40_03950 [Anaerolineae bacterium]|jgi:capsular polysaccharide biosynthesis protein|nr:hypothetical protein [Anaerolineae bacterium]
MEWIALVKMLWRRAWLILLPVALVSVVAVPALLNRGPAGPAGFATGFQYTAAQRLNLPQRDGDYQDVWLASELVVNAFTDWVRSSSFRAEIRAIVGEAVDLAPLGIAADNRRSVGLVQLSHPDAAALAAIAAAAIEVLQTRSQAYFPHLGDAPAQVTVLDAPVIVPAAPPLANRFAPLLQLGVALLAGLGVALLVEYLDTRLRERTDVEAQGLAVLAVIPRH